MSTAWASPSRWYSPSAKQGDIHSALASGGEQWPKSEAESSVAGLVPIFRSSPDSVARFHEMMRLASENALLERRFSEHKHFASQRETELESTLAQLQEELECERQAREELSSRELKLHEVVAASAVGSALLR